MTIKLSKGDFCEILPCSIHLLETNILFIWALVFSTRIFTGQFIRPIRGSALHKALSSHLQNILIPDHCAIKYLNPCDFNWVGGVSWFISSKVLWLYRENNALKFQQHLLNEYQWIKFIGSLFFRGLWKHSLYPSIGFEWQRRLYIHFGQVQKLFTCFIAFWVSNGSEVIYHCLQSYIQVKMDGVIVYPKPEKKKRMTYNAVK